MFKFYLDNQLADQPTGGPVTSIKRNNQLKGLLVNQDVDLIWNKNNNLLSGEISGYIYIKSVFDDSICNEIAIQIYDEVSPSETYLIHTGTIKIAQVELFEQPISLQVKVQDNSFYSYINNNKDIEVDFRATQTKNKETLTPLDFWKVDLFSSQSGVYGSFASIFYKGYRVVEVFDFIIRAITDNKVGFQSTYLSTLPNELFIFKGQSLLNPYTVYPTAPDPVFEVSFQDLFNEIDVCKNLSFYFDATDPENPVMRIENTEDVYGALGSYQFTAIKELKTSVDVSKLYGEVAVGSTNTANGITPQIYTFEEATSYFGWKPENFFPLGQCNRNTKLNLVSNYAISNNVIQEVVIGQSTDYLDSYFLIECTVTDDALNTASATRFTYFGQTAPPYFYNQGINNYEKLQRHSDKFETIFGTFLGIGGNGFRALLGDSVVDDLVYSNLGITLPAFFIPPGGASFNSEFVNETTSGGYDGNNNYSNVTFRYVLPTDGNYSFHQQLKLGVVGIYRPSIFYTIYNTITLYDSAAVLKSATSPATNYYSDGAYLNDNTYVIDGLAGDIVIASYTIVFDGVFGGPGSQPIGQFLSIGWGSFFEANGTPEGGISITAGNRAIKKLLHEFEEHISASNWRTIQANPTLCYEFKKDDIVRKGWIEDVSHDNNTGRTKVKLISQDATT